MCIRDRYSSCGAKNRRITHILTKFGTLVFPVPAHHLAGHRQIWRSYTLHRHISPWSVRTVSFFGAHAPISAPIGWSLAKVDFCTPIFTRICAVQTGRSTESKFSKAVLSNLNTGVCVVRMLLEIQHSCTESGVSCFYLHNIPPLRLEIQVATSVMLKKQLHKAITCYSKNMLP